jgi:hypothetical protein
MTQAPARSVASLAMSSLRFKDLPGFAGLSALPQDQSDDVIDCSPLRAVTYCAGVVRTIRAPPVTTKFHQLTTILLGVNSSTGPAKVRRSSYLANKRPIYLRPKRASFN